MTKPPKTNGTIGITGPTGMPGTPGIRLADIELIERFSNRFSIKFVSTDKMQYFITDKNDGDVYVLEINAKLNVNKQLEDRLIGIIVDKRNEKLNNLIGE